MAWRKFDLKLPPALETTIRQQAEMEKVSVAEWIRRAVKERLEAEDTLTALLAKLREERREDLEYLRQLLQEDLAKTAKYVVKEMQG